MHPIIGTLTGIPIKEQFAKTLNSTVEEPQHDIETGAIHPRKRHVQTKHAATAAA